jgi:outer membrane protein OmpA-like peptidoglycan-associated protein
MRWLVGLPLIVSLAACAAAASEPAGQRFPVFFTPMNANLSNGADGVVAAAAEFANKYPDKKITLEAYAAPPGHHYVEAANIDTMRGAAVTAQLVADGVNGTRISSVSRGEVQPDVPMSKISVRRVDIIVGNPPGAL